VTLHAGEDGAMRIISMTHGGAADLSGQVRVGDVLLRIDDTCIAVLKKPQVFV
jgi:C-terminal processing protease CtpA/Prc